MKTIDIISSKVLNQECNYYVPNYVVYVGYICVVRTQETRFLRYSTIEIFNVFHSKLGQSLRDTQN